jgi:hypothetical protein
LLPPLAGLVLPPLPGLTVPPLPGVVGVPAVPPAASVPPKLVVVPPVELAGLPPEAVLPPLALATPPVPVGLMTLGRGFSSELPHAQSVNDAVVTSAAPVNAFKQ